MGDKTISSSKKCLHTPEGRGCLLANGPSANCPSLRLPHLPKRPPQCIPPFQPHMEALFCFSGLMVMMRDEGFNELKILKVPKVSTEWTASVMVAAAVLQLGR